MRGRSGMPACYGVEWDARECAGCIFFAECCEETFGARMREAESGQGGDDRTYTREQLAHHVWRMREKSGCTFSEIARAMRVSSREARRLYREAME